MSVASPQQSNDELMERAGEALGQGRYFEAERMASRALSMARDEDNFDRMARTVPPLREARRKRLEQALNVGAITIVDTPITEEMGIEAGCYLVRPPLVGVDARRLRLAADSRDVPVAVLCREPPTRLGLCPIVAIGSDATVRTKVDPPADPHRPDTAWFVAGLEALGDWAIDSIDPETDVGQRINALLARLDAVPDHDRLHECLEEACREAQQAFSADEGAPAKAASTKNVQP